MPARGDAHIPSPHVMHVLPGTVLAPEPRVVGRHLPWGRVLSEQAARTATPDNIKAPMTILFPGRTCVV